MITIYKKDNNELKEIEKFEKDSWINLSNPTKEEINTIIDKFNLPEDFITDSIDIDEKSRVDVEDGNVLVILRVPTPDINDVETPFNTSSFGIILLKDYCMTVYKNAQFNILADLFNSKKIKNNVEVLEDRMKFLLRIFHKSSVLYLKYLKEINITITQVEKEFNKNSNNSSLIKLLNLEKSLIYFKTGLRSNEVVMNKFKKYKTIQKDEINQDLLEEALIENAQAIELSNIYSKVLNDMKNYFFSIISNNLNKRVSGLTVITAALTIPMVLTGFYGMNLNLPFQDNKFTYIAVITVSLLSVLLSVVIVIKDRNNK